MTLSKKCDTRVTIMGKRITIVKFDFNKDTLEVYKDNKEIFRYPFADKGSFEMLCLIDNKSSEIDIGNGIRLTREIQLNINTWNWEPGRITGLIIENNEEGVKK
jgi:hypothetical protein